jgi:hypothetical protein
MTKSLSVAVGHIVRHISSHLPKLVFNRRFLRPGAFNNSVERGNGAGLISSSALLPTFRRRYVVLFLVPFLLVTGYLLWPTSLQSIGAEPSNHAPGIQAEHHPPPSTQIIYAPTTGLPQTGRAELVLNNNGSDEMIVTPTFYSKDGQPFVGDQITLKAAEVRRLPVADLTPTSLQTAGDGGGISLSYFGGMKELGAQIALFGEGRAGSVDVSFSGAGDYKSTVQEAVWWSPAGASATFALGNGSDVPIDVKLVFGSGQERELQVGSFSTEIIVYKKPKANSEGRADSVRLEVSGPVGSLRTAGYTRSSNNDFTSTLRFYDPQTVRQPNLYATNLKLKKSTPRLVLKNISDSPISTTPRFLPLDGFTGDPLELPPVKLAAREAKEVDLAPLISAASRRADFKMVSVEVVNDGPTASLIGALSSRDRTSSMTYDTPLRDSGPMSRSTGSYPWRLDGDYSTLVTITNISQKQATFAGLISFEGGQYVLEQRRVEVGATAVVDLNRIRDEQIPDRDGQTIPQSVTDGQFVWSAVSGNREKKLIGRMQIVSKVNRVSRSYSCELCCLWSFNDARVSPSSVNLLVTGSTGLQAQARYYTDCNGNFWLSPWYPPASGFDQGEWQSSDPSIATVSPTNVSSTTLTAVSGGQTSIAVTWEDVRWFFSGAVDDCVDFPFPASAGANVQVTTPTVTVNEVGFTGDYQITKWVGGTIIDNPDGSSPTWKSTSNPNHPAAYTKGAMLTMFAKLGISPSAPNISAKIRVFRDSTVIATKDITLSGTTITVTGLTTSVALENNVKAIAPMFDWDISYDGGNFWEHIADTGPHTLYFTWSTPISPPFSNFGGSTFPALYDKALERACVPANGGTDIPTVVSRINTQVATDTVYNPGAVIPGHPLGAYSAGCACGDLAHLLRGLIRSIGINGSVQYMWAGPNSSTQRMFIVGSVGNAGVFNPTFRLTLAAHPDGIAPANPHFIFHAAVPVSGTLYDPSYGSSYSALSFVETANMSTPQQTSTTYPGTIVQSGWTCPH